VSLFINKYRNHNPVDLQVAINTIKVEFEDEKRKAKDALNSRIIQDIEYSQTTANECKKHLITEPVKRVIAKVRECLDQTIPNSIKALDRLLKKQDYTPEEKEKVEHLELEAFSIYDTIESLYQLSMSEAYLLPQVYEGAPGLTFKDRIAVKNSL
jgi:hypothetical protein